MLGKYSVKFNFYKKKNLFFLVFTLFFVISTVNLLCGSGKLESLTFSNCNDFFADTFNIYNYLSSKNIYTGDSFFTKGYYGFMIPRFIRNYPPMAFMHIDILKRLLHSGNTHLFLAVYISVLLCVPLCYLLYRKFQGTERERLFFISCVLFSSVFIFSLERGNIIMLVILYTTIFLFYHDSENRFLREFALFSLAMAASMKVYPAILGLLLVYKQQWHRCFRLFIYGILLSFLPFLYFKGGFNLIPEMLFNVFSPFSIHQPAYLLFGSHLPALHTVFSSCPAEKIQSGLYHTGCAIGILSCILACCDCKSWRRATLLVIFLLLVPKIGGMYNFLYLIPCMVLFFNNNNENLENNLFSVLLALIFVPMLLPSCRLSSGLYFLKGTAFDFFILLLLFVSIRDLYTLVRGKKSPNQ